MSTPSIDIAGAAKAHADLRAATPLVQNITNYVVMTLSANVLLALGASPAMVHAVEEAEDFTAISSSLVVNIGTLSPHWVEAMHLSAKKAVSKGKNWILDPVGCGATPYRTGVAANLAGMKPAIIRGNASEILSLAGAAGAGGKGVEFDGKLGHCARRSRRACQTDRRGRRRHRQNRLRHRRKGARCHRGRRSHDVAIDGPRLRSERYGGGVRSRAATAGGRRLRSRSLWRCRR